MVFLIWLKHDDVKSLSVSLSAGDKFKYVIKYVNYYSSKNINSRHTPHCTHRSGSSAAKKSQKKKQRKKKQCQQMPVSFSMNVKIAKKCLNQNKGTVAFIAVTVPMRVHLFRKVVKAIVVSIFGNIPCSNKN